MSTIRRNQLQTAQGMVEFALVLPILLLLVLGVFAFGHLFFTYSSVVSASREASRWGSAVGVADSLNLRFQDCNAIRATAVRLGTFAGVTAADAPDDTTTPGIYVGFDHGPNDPGPDFDTCADNSGPTEVGYGDRVKVRVTVQYTPIVPIVNIPSFPLTAITARTIIRSLPVGEAPTAAPACPSTQIVLQPIPNPPPTSYPFIFDPVVGQEIDVLAHVTTSNGSVPTGTLTIWDDDLDYPHSCVITGDLGPADRTCVLAPAWPKTGSYTTIGLRHIYANYEPSGCFQASSLPEGVELNIWPADTITTIKTVTPEPSKHPGDKIVISFTVAPTNPGAGIPTGFVTISDLSGNIWGGNPLVGGTGTLTLNPGPMVTTTYVATYDGDTNFKPSTSAPYVHTVTAPPTSTPTRTPTVVFTPTQTRTPTPTPSKGCNITAGPVTFDSANYSYHFQVINSGTISPNVIGVDLTWPSNPISSLMYILFGTSVNQCDIRKNGGNCLYQSSPGLPPPSQSITNSSNNWDSTFAGVPAGSPPKLMRFIYNASTTGPYTMVIHFDQGCSPITVTGNWP